MHRSGHLCAFLVKDLPVLGSEYAQLVVLKENYTISVAYEGPRVASQKMFVGANAQHKGASEASPHKYVGILGAYDCQAVRPFENGQSCSHRLYEIAGEAAGDEMSNDFGIGVTAELHPVRRELPPERCVVFDDAVMDDRNETVNVSMRVGVGVGRRPVGGPTRVTDPHATRGGPLGQIPYQIGQAAGALAHMELAGTG
jgi:hypothetical protein